MQHIATETTYQHMHCVALFVLKLKFEIMNWDDSLIEYNVNVNLQIVQHPHILLFLRVIEAI